LVLEIGEALFGKTKRVTKDVRAVVAERASMNVTLGARLAATSLTVTHNTNSYLYMTILELEFP
jgi:hypothetical protein